MDSSTTTHFWLHDCLVDLALGRITRGEQSVQLGTHQVQVLTLLTRSPSITLSQREIEKAVWGDTPTTGDALYRCIAQLRAALCDHARQPRFIQTVPRHGYRLIAPIHYPPTPLDSQKAAPPALPDVEPGKRPAPPPPLAAPAISRWRSLLISCCIGSALLLAVGMYWNGAERARARREATDAAQLAQFMQNVFASNDSSLAYGRPESALQLLDRATQRVSTDLKNQPQMQMRLLETIGRSYVHQQLAEPAVPALQEALRIRRSLGSSSQAEMAVTLSELGEALRGVSRFEDAKLAYIEALDIFQLTQAQPSRSSTLIIDQLGNLEVDQGHFTEGVRMLDRSLQQMRTIQGFYHTDTAGVLLDLSRACACGGDVQRADQTLREARRIYQAAAPTLDPNRLAAENAVARILLQQQHFEEAAAVLERTLSSRQQLFGPAGIPISESLNLLASVRNGQGRLDEAETLKLASLAALDGLGAGADMQRATVKLSLATLLMRSNQFARSEALLREVIAFYDATLPADHLSRTSAEHYLGEALLAQSKYAEAETILQIAIQRMQRGAVPQWRIARSMNTLGEILYRRGKTSAAQKLLLESYAQLANDTSAKQTARTRAQQRMATLIGNPTTLAGVFNQR